MWKAGTFPSSTADPTGWPVTLGGWAVTTAQQESQPPCRVGIIPEEVEPGCRMGSPGAKSQPQGPRNLISRPFPAGVGLIIRGQHGADCFSTAREGPSQTLRDPPRQMRRFSPLLTWPPCRAWCWGPCGPQASTWASSTSRGQNPIQPGCWAGSGLPSPSQAEAPTFSHFSDI